MTLLFASSSSLIGLPHPWKQSSLFGNENVRLVLMEVFFAAENSSGARAVKLGKEVWRRNNGGNCF
jgi:hypothetical protein